MTVTSLKDSVTIKIFIDELLHLCFVRSEFIGLQSYMDKELFVLEINSKGGDIKVEYDRIDKWKLILKEINKLL